VYLCADYHKGTIPSNDYDIYKKKHLKSEEYFNYMRSLIKKMIHFERVKLNPGLPWKKTAFSREEKLFTRKLDLNLKKKLMKHCNVCSTFCDAETWTLREGD
jgi:hypothetical protein